MVDEAKQILPCNADAVSLPRNWTISRIGTAVPRPCVDRGGESGRYCRRGGQLNGREFSSHGLAKIVHHIGAGKLGEAIGDHCLGGLVADCQRDLHALLLNSRSANPEVYRAPIGATILCDGQRRGVVQQEPGTADHHSPLLEQSFESFGVLPSSCSNCELGLGSAQRGDGLARTPR